MKCSPQMLRGSLLVIVLACFSAANATAQKITKYFYRNAPYGSDAVFNPVSLILNGGFDELQIYGHANRLSEVPWASAGRNVWKNITSPWTQIRLYGWERFLRQEVFPLGLSTDEAQYFPNYTLHLIGGGMVYRKTWEWYDEYGWPLAPVWAAATAMAYHYVNEIVENGKADGFFSNVDPIADLLIFDPLGIVLFSFDGVAEFFSTSVKLNEWSCQPAVSLSPFGIHNTAQNFVLKYPITASGRTSLFYHFGAFGILGLSFSTGSEDALSFGLGLSSKKIYVADIRNGTVTYSIVVGPIGGLYYDRSNSLLASLVVSDSFTDIVRMNVYPGLIHLGPVSPGVFLSAGERGRLTAGVTASFLPAGLSGHHP